MALGVYTALHATLARHRKTARLVRELGVSRPQAIGHLVLLWCAVLDQEPDGVLGAWSVDDIAAAAEWEGESKTFVAALVAAEWLDQDHSVHDWAEFCSLEKTVKKRTYDRERQRQKRLSQKVVTTPNDVVAETESERERETDLRDDGQNAKPQTEPQRPSLGEVERVGFPKFGSLGGECGAEIRKLDPPPTLAEVAEAMATDGDSWNYAAKVIRTLRKKAQKARAGPGHNAPKLPDASEYQTGVVDLSKFA